MTHVMHTPHVDIGTTLVFSFLIWAQSLLLLTSVTKKMAAWKWADDFCFLFACTCVCIFLSLKRYYSHRLYYTRVISNTAERYGLWRISEWSRTPEFNYSVNYSPWRYDFIIPVHVSILVCYIAVGLQQCKYIINLTECWITHTRALLKSW